MRSEGSLGAAFLEEAPDPGDVVLAGDEIGVVVFAKKDMKGRYRVTSGERGKFLIEKDTKTGSKIIPNVGTLQEFTAEVKKNVKSQQTIRKDG